jgi:hypothetical protein
MSTVGIMLADLSATVASKAKKLIPLIETMESTHTVESIRDVVGELIELHAYTAVLKHYVDENIRSISAAESKETLQLLATLILAAQDRAVIAAKELNELHKKDNA